MLTKKDKQDIKTIVVDVMQEVVMPAFELVATKKEMAAEFKKVRSEMTTKAELQAVKNSLREEMEDLKHDVDDKIDAVYKEVVDFRQEQTMHTRSHQRINSRLDKLEAR